MDNMNFSSSETWLDILIIVVALISLGVAIFMALRLMKGDDSKKEETQPIPETKPIIPVSKTTVPSGRQTENKKKASGTSKTVFDQIAASPPPPPKAVSKPVFDTISQSAKEIANSQGFVADKLQLESASRLLLQLKNTGAKVIYKRVSPGPNNEVTITNVQAAQPLNSLLPEYPKDSSIHFHLDADNVIGRTFQFTLYYGDLQGNLYRQDISGLGKEYPIVDPVVKIA